MVTEKALYHSAPCYGIFTHNRYCCKCSSGKIKTGRSAVIYQEYVLFQENEACTRNILSVNKKVFKVFI